MNKRSEAGAGDEDLIMLRRSVIGCLGHWQQDTDFAGVRGTEALAKLPEAEQADWTKLWQDVAALGKQAAAK